MFRLRLFLLLFFVWVSVTHAEVPKLLHYQGHLVDSQGLPLQGAHQLTFRVYKQDAGGEVLWSQVFPQAQMAEGNFAVLLDVGTANPALTFNESYWLSIAVDADSEMTPRQQIASSAYSINADTVDGIQASATPTANNLLPLNAQAKFPQSVLDIQEGQGGQFDADTVDGFHASATVQPNTILPLNASALVPLNAIPQGPASGLDADKVDGSHASDFYNLDNERFTGTLLASHVEHDGLDADTLDGADLDEIYNTVDARIDEENSYIDGSSLEASALTERAMSTGAWKKIKEFSKLHRGGKVTIEWKMKSSDAWGVQTQLYINGSPVGLIYNVGEHINYITVMESNVSVSSGDIIQIFCLTYGAQPGTLVYVKDLKLFCANPTVPAESSGY